MSLATLARCDGGAGPVTASHDDFEYDAFVDYHESDDGWVQDHLILRLNRSDIRCADRNDFRLGPPKLTEMERCIGESRWTVLVITRQYLESSWNEHCAV